MSQPPKITLTPNGFLGGNIPGYRVYFSHGLRVCLKSNQGIFGFTFGLIDVPDVNAYKLKLEVLGVEHYCYPIGALLGGVAGVGNEYIRHMEIQYSPVAVEFDDDL